MKKYRIVEFEKEQRVFTYDTAYDTKEEAEAVVKEYIEDDNNPNDLRENKVSYVVEAFEPEGVSLITIQSRKAVAFDQLIDELCESESHDYVIMKLFDFGFTKNEIKAMNFEPDKVNKIHDEYVVEASKR